MDQAAISTNPGAELAARADQGFPSLDHAPLNQRAKGNLELITLGWHGQQVFIIQRGCVGNPLTGDPDIVCFALNPDKAAMQFAGNRASGTGPKERIEDQITGVAGGNQHPCQQGLGFLGRMRLVAFNLDALTAIADRQRPVRPHLDIIVERFHGFVIERVTGFAVVRGPEQDFMGIGKPAATEIRHRVGLAPDDIIEHPEPGVLEHGANTVDIVIGADDPDRAIGFQHSPCLIQPGVGKSIIGGKSVKLVPVVEDGRNRAFIRPGQHRSAQLQVIGRICKNHVHRGIGEPAHNLNRIALNDGVLSRTDRNGAR